MANIILPGRAQPLASVDLNLSQDAEHLLNMKVVAVADVGRSRSDAVSFEVAAVEPTDIVELEFDDGLKLWQSVEKTEADFSTIVSRSAPGQMILVPPEITFDSDRSRSRGLSTYLLRTVRLLRVDPIKRLAQASAVELAKKIESTLDLGFRKCERIADAGGKYRIALGSADTVPSNEKILILLHGTFSSTQGSFGDLASARADQLWDILTESYSGGIFALEHRSVTASPIENAIEILEALPKGAQVSFMSHSRGGLIAELLCRASRADIAKNGAIDDTDIEIFSQSEAHGHEKSLLVKLAKLLADKDLKVDRVIRVGGPIAGTTLASERLDRYLSVALNVFELMPALKTTGVAGLLKSFLMAFIHTKARPDDLPGLEAMMPRSPLISMLNRPDIEVTSALRVIGGDAVGTGVLHRLTVLAADLFFLAQHDFVVNTASMSRGARRAVERAPFLDTAPDVTHFSYFRNQRTQRVILNAAIDNDRFATESISRATEASDILAAPEFASRSNADRPVCFVLPGVMGSHLAQSGDWIWANPIALPFGGISRLRMTKANVSATGTMRRYYGEVAAYLARSHRVIPYHYDWRLSVLTQGHTSAANRLAAAVEAELNRTDRPIRFLAHSMGGLIVRALFQTRPDLMAQIKARRGSRFVMLGTPNGGAMSMLHTMIGRGRSIKQLETADIFNDMRDVLGIVTGLHGPLQLLPQDRGGHYMKPAFWAELRNILGADWPVPGTGDLSRTRTAIATLGDHGLDPELCVYVAGRGKELTLSSLKLQPEKTGASRIQFYGTRQGDGTVPWHTGVPKGIQCYLMDAVHGDMARTRSSFAALQDLLEHGTTTQLGTIPQAMSRAGGDALIPITPEPIDVLPRTKDITDAFMGTGTPTRAPDPATSDEPVRISLVHGDLCFARYPVIVGHHTGDPIMGAEAALDDCLDHYLSEVRDLGLYPGALKTCEVVLREASTPPGAVVVGLGPYGELSPGELKTTLLQAVLRYGLMQRQTASAGSNGPRRLGLSALLVGHLSGAITTQDSVAAILEVIDDANRLLGDHPITELEIIELFDDRALAAASAIDDVLSNGRFGAAFSFERKVNRVQGARVRSAYGHPSDWWQRVTITRSDQDADVLKFIAISDAGKADFSKSVMHPKALQSLLTQRDDGTRSQENTGKLLFELLVPLSMKGFAKEDQRLLLVLDGTSAAYPWELMEDNFANNDPSGALSGSRETAPLAVRAPIIRQLVVANNTVPRAKTATALIVGNPDTKGAMASLPGATQEAEAVKTLLEGRFKVTPRIEEGSSRQLYVDMFLEPKKILHIASHGVYETAGPGSVPGLVLPQGQYLTADLIAGMSYVPEFVFLNCCHVGHVSDGVGEIAASLSAQFISKGAKAVIAAGWEVADNAACLFAKTFYKAMLTGQTFGTATQRARAQVYAAHPETNTWGAYQCYGDPDYRMREAGSEEAQNAEVARFYSVEQATRAATNIAESAMSARISRTGLLAKLSAIEAGQAEGWDVDVSFTTAMGQAYAKLDAYEPAIEQLEQAVAAGAAPPILERLQNLKILHTAEHVHATYGKERTEARAKLRRQVRDLVACFKVLDKLPGQNTSAARCGLRGSAYKRLAWVETGTRRAKALDRMIAEYRNAMTISTNRNAQSLDLYAAMNWIAGQVLMGEIAPEGTPLAVWLDRMWDQGKAEELNEPSFSTGIVCAEIDILKGISNPVLATPALAQTIQEDISRSWKRGGSSRHLRSLREQIAFLRAMQPPQAQTTWLRQIERFVQDQSIAQP